jgi:hypothetical protein
VLKTVYHVTGNKSRNRVIPNPKIGYNITIYRIPEAALIPPYNFFIFDLSKSLRFKNL